MRIELTTNNYYNKYNNLAKQSNISTPRTFLSAQEFDSVSFKSKAVVQKGVSEKLSRSKGHLLNKVKEFLSTASENLTEEAIEAILIRRAHGIMKFISRRCEEIDIEANELVNNPMLNPQQKTDRLKGLLKEAARLKKTSLYEPIKTKKSNENFDYILLNKFREALLNDEFDLEPIFLNHYSDLSSIETVEELKQKYPSIKVPPNPKDVIAKKIVDSFNRSFFEYVDKLFDTRDQEIIIMSLSNYFEQLFAQLAPVFGYPNGEELFKVIGETVSRLTLKTYEKLKENGGIKYLPEKGKNTLQISNVERGLVRIDYDKFTMHALREIFLKNKKINDIEYTEGDIKINLSELRNTEYKFERISEKIKKFISDARDIIELQRNYSKYTAQELQGRLDFYSKTSLWNTEELMNLFIDFYSCKFTDEDINYLIKFLKIIDDIADSKITIDEALKTLNENSIRPQGTIKLNETERKAIEEQIALETQKNLELQRIRTRFNNIINKLYENDLASIAEDLSKYYPQSYTDSEINEVNRIINLVETSFQFDNKNKLRNHILRCEIYEDYIKSNDSTALLNEGIRYANNFSRKEAENRIGQYLLNREIINNYPESKKLVNNPQMLDIIMERFENDKRQATEYLCNFENFCELENKEKRSIFKIIDLFKEKTIQKYILENHYINYDTEINFVTRNGVADIATIASSAKTGIYDRYNFPNCIEFFKKFETALTTEARQKGDTGIKRWGDSNNKQAQYTVEAKIKGYPDRLLSSKNNLYFDIYAPEGLH